MFAPGSILVRSRRRGSRRPEWRRGARAEVSHKTICTSPELEKHAREATKVELLAIPETRAAIVDARRVILARVVNIAPLGPIKQTVKYTFRA